MFYYKFIYVSLSVANKMVMEWFQESMVTVNLAEEESELIVVVRQKESLKLVVYCRKQMELTTLLR